MALSGCWAAVDSSTNCVSVSFFGMHRLRLTTASRAVTTEAPHWRKQPAGQDPGGPKALNHAATVTLCWRRKASHFWGILLLVCGTAEHGRARYRVPLYVCSQSAKKSQG